MSEPIPLRDGHSRHRPRRRGRGRRRGSARWEEKLRVEEEEEEVWGWCVPQSTEKARSQLRVLCFRIQFVVIWTRPSFVRYVCSFFLARVSSAQPPTTIAFLSSLSRYTARCQAYRSVVATLSCARDNQLSHATPRLGPREFRGKEMNELASSLTRERGVDVFEERSDCEWKEEEKRLVNYWLVNLL